jgi:hypothetical protein
MREPVLYLLRCTAFVAMASLVYVALIGIWAIAVPEEVRRNMIQRIDSCMGLQMHDLQSQVQVDVIVLGGSHAYRGYDPRAFQQYGISLFNLGSSAQSMLQSEVLLEQYLGTLDPQLVIVEVYPGSFAIDGVESSLDLITNGKLDRYMAKMALEVGNIRTLNALIYSAERHFLGVGNNTQKHAPPDSLNRYVSNGFVERTTGHFVVPPHERTPSARTARKDQLTAFRRMMERLRRENREVVLVEAPITHWRYRSLLNHTEHERLMKSFAPYINMNGMAGLDDSTHFYDSNHLNQQGVEIFNAALLDSLKRGGFIPFPPTAH